jgi:hypothetical protein
MLGNKKLSPILIFIGALVLSACSDPNREILTQRVIDAESRVKALGTALKSGSVRNAVLLKEYGNIVRNDRPELDSVITTLIKEGTVNGQQYQFLNTRLTELKKHTAQIGNPQQLIPEADALVLAASTVNFNNALSDPLNVIADMSDGKLARLGVLSKSEEAVYNETKDYGSGSQMIGNPAYGQWNNNRGTSFWEFYGMYAMFNTLTRSNRANYSDWNRNRPYSHYQDYGVDRYGSANERSKYRSSYGKSAGVNKTASNSKTFGGQRKSSSLSKGSGGNYRGTTPPPRKSSSLSRKSSSSFGSSKSSSGSLRSSSTYSRSYRGGK